MNFIICLVYKASFTHRTCASTANDVKPCDGFKIIVEAVQGTMTDCYTCSTDNCNLSNSFQSAFIPIVAAIVVHLFCYR